jgi:hypothetical protein
MFLLTLICLAPNFGHTTSAADTRIGPKAYLPENIFEFEPVLEGVAVVHDFILHNQGDEPLDILRVKSG